MYNTFMHPVLFTFGNTTFYTHGAMAALGVVCGIMVAYFLAPSKNRNRVVDNLVLTAIFGIIGARLVYILVYSDQFPTIGSYFSLTGGGFVSYGGILFGAGALTLILKKQKEKILNWFDFTAPAFFLGLGVGRVGEILAGEYSGIETNSSIAHGFLPISVFNAPFFEAILCLLLFFFGIKVYQQEKSISGFTVLLLFSIYSSTRFAIDFGRVESKILVGLSLGQFISLALFIFCAILLIRVKNHHKKGSKNEIR